MRSVLPAVAFLTFSLASLAPAQTPIRVLTLDASRFDTCQGNSYQYTGRGLFQFAYLELTSQANFGPNGVVKRAVKFVAPVPTLTGSALSGADVVILGQAKDLDKLPPNEIALLNSFLCKGGGVLVFGNPAAQATRTIVQGSLASFASGEFRTVANTPMTTGPFGTTNPQAKLRGGWSGGFASLGPTGTSCITRGNATIGATFNVGPGKLVMLADEEIIKSSTACGVAGWDVETRKMWLNSFAWVAPADGFSFTTNDIIFEAYGSGCPGTGGVAPKVIWSGRPKSNGYLEVNVWDARPSSAGVFISGIQRFTQGACWLHVNPILFTIPVAIDATGRAVLGTGLPDTSAFRGASLMTQVALLDSQGANGLSTSNGAEIRFR